MKYAIVTSSRSGNTRLVANALMRTLSERDTASQAMYVGDIPPVELDACANDAQRATEPACGSVDMIEHADTILFGFWTDKGDCTESAIPFLTTLSGKRVFLFGTAGFGGSQAYFDRILHKVASHLPKDARLAGGAMCQGKMDIGVRRRYEGMLAQNPGEARTQAMIDNFDAALSHPDEADFKRIGDAAIQALGL